MRNIYCRYKNGSLILTYDDGSQRISTRYVFYTLKEALQKFRKDNGLQRKHIKVQNYIKEH